LFLIVEAATIVAKSDWAKLRELDPDRSVSFSKYFDAFDELASGLGPLDRGVALCLDALAVTNDL